MAVWITAFSLSTSLSAQSPVAGPPTAEVTHAELSPSTIYAETLAPFDRTRADLGNWSDVELAAFNTAMATAKAECKRLEQTAHEGEEALALARLCSVGMDWDGTYSAARWYTRKTAPPEEAPHLPVGYALLLQADLNLQATRRAIEDLTEVHDRLSLTADTDSIFRYAVEVLEVMRLDDALQAALMRQPQLLEVIAGKSDATPALQPGVAEEEAWHTLGLLHMAHRAEEEEQAKAQLLEAIAARTVTPSKTDLYLAQRGRKRYEWLDRPVPEMHVARNAYPVPRVKPAPVRTELLVIEREDAADAPALAVAIDALRTRVPKGAQATLVLLKSHDVPAPKPQQAPAAHALYTTEDLLETFGFSNGPLFLICDEQQRVKYLGTGTTAWLNPQQQAERLISVNMPN